MITALLLGVLTASAAAPAQSDDAWLAWQGCWRATTDGDDNVVCIVAEGAGVRMITLAAGLTKSEVTVTADGVARPISQEGCSGTQQASWSQDKQRLFM